MRSKLGLLLLAGVALGGCGNKPYDLADRGVEAVNTPVVTRADYVFDAAAPGGMLAASEKPRLDSWFRGLDLGYGDLIYVDAPSADSARYEVAQVAGAFGMTRTLAEVPNCPNWSQRAQPNFQNRQMSNYACAINSNLAAMVANPGDLVNGREGTVLVDPYTSTKAVDLYRATPPTGTKGLQDTSAKGGK